MQLNIFTCKDPFSLLNKFIYFACHCFLIIQNFMLVTCSIRSVMQKHLEKMGEVTFDKIFNQRLGECLKYSSLQMSLHFVALQFLQTVINIFHIKWSLQLFRSQLFKSFLYMDFSIHSVMTRCFLCNKLFPRCCVCS